MPLLGTWLNKAGICSRATQANCPDSGVECVGYVENARTVVEVHVPGLVEHHFSRRPLLVVETHLARAGEGGDRAVSIDLADSAIVVTSDEQVPLSIDGDASREGQSSLGGRSSVPRDALFVHLADPVVLRIGDVHVSFAIECKGVGLEPRLNSWTAVAREAQPPGAGQGGDRPGGIDLSHAGVIDKVQIPSSVEGHLVRFREFGGGGRTSVAGMPRLARASKGGDDSVFVYRANPIVEPV